jgi:hypothetical protein
VREAGGRPRCCAIRMYRPGAVLSAAPELLALAERLRAEEGGGPEVEAAERLVMDRESPLHYENGGPLAARLVREALASSAAARP